MANIPKGQTRESIEDELNAGERERVIRQLEETIRDLEEFFTELRKQERLRGLPESNRTKSLPERMAALGLTKEAVDKVSDGIDAIFSMRAGKSDEVSEDIRREIAERTEAELLALDQLQDILDKRRREI